MMIHDLDMARFLLGEEPVEVSAMAAVPGRSRDRARPATSTPPWSR
jgi:predicted dehydrogenase